MTKPFTNETAPALRHMSDAELVQFSLADDYEILEELGRGGMAIVYRAREKALDRDVAIKVLPARLVIDKGFVERFEHEARTAAKLEHPNIVPIYRVGRAGPNSEVIYFVMKLLRGQSLSSVMAERGKLDPADVRRILTETASALNYAAKSNVVHRDIKPDNIMLDSEGRCVVTDFGIAKAPGGQQTTAGTSLGTPRYMSPEHAMGQQLDGRSDMYSLGIVAYQCLVGKAPFEADEPFAVLYKHIHDPLPAPTLDSDEARQLYSVIERMLAKRPSDRYQTWNELIAALGGQISDPSLVGISTTNPSLMAPTEVMPTPRPWSLSRWRMLSRTRKVVWSSVAVAAVATVFAVVMAPAIDGNAASPGSKTIAATSKSPTTRPNPDSAGGKLDSVVPPPKPKPSPRAATIIAANAKNSKCAKADTLISKPMVFALLVDSIADRPRGDFMPINYDVCGLPVNAGFTATFTLEKLNQRNPIGRQGPITFRSPETVIGIRSRERYMFDMIKASPGDYRLDVTVLGSDKQLPLTTSRRFKITDKK